MSLIMSPVIAFLCAFFICGTCNGSPATTTGNLYLGTKKVPRDQAKHLCEERSMELVSIQNSEINEEIFSLLKENEIDYALWTSGNRNADGKTWTWLDGKKIEYSKWAPNQPDNARGDESCMEVYKSDSTVLWNDQPCQDERSFICAPRKITENFYLGKDKVTRDEAEQLCEEKSMKLLSIQSSEKNEAVFHLLHANEIDYALWTSGNRRADGKTWTWLDDEKMEYFNWGPTEPNNARGNEACIEVKQKNSTVVWNDDPCEDKRAFICEKIENDCETKLVNVTVNGKVCSRVTEAPSTPSKKFYISTERATRPQALEQCSKMFMELATLRNGDENDALNKLLKKDTPYWIGAGRESGKPWKWLDGEPITYFKWAKGEPNYKGNSGICVEVVATRTALFWNDQYCSSERRFVCEKLTPVVNITVKGNLTISLGSTTNQEDNDCTVVVNKIG